MPWRYQYARQYRHDMIAISYQYHFDIVKIFKVSVKYYRRFIKDFSSIDKPLFGLLQGNQQFKWEEKQKKSFKKISVYF